MTHNERKLKTLRVLADGRARTVGEIVAEMRAYRSWENSYWYLARLASFGILKRTRIFQERRWRVAYEITRRGLARLRWLAGHMRSR